MGAAFVNKTQPLATTPLLVAPVQNLGKNIEIVPPLTQSTDELESSLEEEFRNQQPQNEEQDKKSEHVTTKILRTKALEPMKPENLLPVNNKKKRGGALVKLIPERFEEIHDAEQLLDHSGMNGDYKVTSHLLELRAKNVPRQVEFRQSKRLLRNVEVIPNPSEQKVEVNHQMVNSISAINNNEIIMKTQSMTRMQAQQAHLMQSSVPRNHGGRFDIATQSLFSKLDRSRTPTFKRNNISDVTFKEATSTDLGRPKRMNSLAGNIPHLTGSAVSNRMASSSTLQHQVSERVLQLVRSKSLLRRRHRVQTVGSNSGISDNPVMGSQHNCFEQSENDTHRVLV